MRLLQRLGRGVPVTFAAAFVLGACTTGGDPAIRAEDDTTTTVTQAASQPDDTSTTTQADTTAETTTPDETEATPTRLAGDYTVDVVSTRPHDPDAFTQGLELHDGRLLESTGLYGESERRWVDPQTGEVLARTELDDEEFGEGITMFEGTVYQLTWQAGRVILADNNELGELTSNSYEGEGWGLCAAGDEFVMSNGSDQLTIRDANTFEVVRTVDVTDANGNAIASLNELECVGDQVLANIWGLDIIVVIDTSTGAVDAVIDASTLRPANAPADDLDFALNGIAYDANTGHYLLTGKLWDTLYEVSLTPS